MPRVLVLGLDCAEPSLVFDKWRADLPNLRRLMAAGVYGRLRSCDPPITVPAWACMTSGRDPGELGIYGFRNRKNRDYGPLGIASSQSVQADRLWDLLGRAGKSVVVVGVPPTYPVPPVNGHLIACFLTPGPDVPFTHPPELAAEIQKVAGEYRFDIREYRTEDKAGLLEQVYEMTRKRFRVLRHLIREKPWDFLMAVEMGPDRMHHGFWKFHDPAHHLYEPGNPFEHVIRDYYRYLDGEIGDLLRLVDGDTAVLVVSDHGAKRMEGGVCLNEWLIQEKYLRLGSRPRRIASPAQLDVDWPRTLAWGEGGYYGRIYLNVKGREPQGIVAASEIPRIRAEIKAGLEAMRDGTGNPLGTRVLIPEEIYREVNGVAPDLLVYFGDLGWRSVGTVGHGAVLTRENDTGPDDANHSTHGVFIMAKRGDWDRAGEETGLAAPLSGLSLYDVAPTVLTLFGLPVPDALRGAPIVPTDEIPCFG